MGNTVKMARTLASVVVAVSSLTLAACGSKYETPLGVGRDRDDYRASPCRRVSQIAPGSKLACFEIEQEPEPADWRARMIETVG
ncbi:MAG: hypothetical protein KAY22_02310 [Rhizorhabdus sp.]|uniref:hypothetical protein n=1 Tax=Rhizorhabdus sp. TaxID=1968843 RepID=UPI001B72981C|nr:hypothetical protein [Rhizorhabdus sp.]MBP8231114.1 hypothetical protein [Rhizorhabdus sp.]